VANGGTIMVCPPCAKVRGSEKEDLIGGVELAGSVAMLGVVSEGAATLTFQSRRVPGTEDSRDPGPDERICPPPAESRHGTEPCLTEATQKAS